FILSSITHIAGEYFKQLAGGPFPLGRAGVIAVAAKAAEDGTGAAKSDGSWLFRWASSSPLPSLPWGRCGWRRTLLAHGSLRCGTHDGLSQGGSHQASPAR